nr:putative large secreted protein [Kibdelosporangium sp. MJ126-NF4]
MAHASPPAEKTAAPVEVTELRTETTRVFANPSGTRTMEVYAGPVRTRKGGDWVPIDTTLVRAADGSISPRATVIGLRLSGGGTAPFVTAERDSRQFSLSWPGSLPSPELAGDTATYPEVLPGVDMRVRADSDGFSQLLVVKNAAAAANPELRAIRYGTATKGLTVRPGADGATSVVDDQGRTVFASGTPSMWDSSAQKIALAGKVRSEERAMGLQVEPGQLTVVPDTRMLTSPDTTFPVYIDPSYSAGANRWTYVNRDDAGESYWTTKENNKAKVGKTWGTAGLYRSLFQMNTGMIAGSKITKAWFSVTMDHSAACAATGVDLWNTRPIDPAVPLTWNNSKSHWLTYLASAKGTANESSACPKPDFPMELSSPALMKLMQDTATGDKDTVTFGLKINSDVETSQDQWKYFYANTARINVEYNSRPRVPADVNVEPPKPCATAAAPTAFSTSTPSFSAVISDPEGENLAGELEILSGDTVIRTLATPLIGSGGAFSWPPLDPGVLPEDQPGAVFGYRARARDASGLVSPYTERCAFTVDKVKPGTPVVASTDYPNGTAVRSVGETGIVTFGRAAADTDIAGYRYGFNPDRITSWVGAAPDGSASVPITLWSDSPGGTIGISRTLYVRAIDRAGNGSSAPATWSLTAKPRAVTAAPVRGDTNGDRRADVAAVFDLGDNRTAAWNFVAGGSGFPTGHVGWDTGVNGGFPAFRTATVRGDFTGDGLGDIAILREDPDRKTRLFLLRSDGNRFVSEAESWVGTTYHLSHLKMVAGDFDDDGDDDIAVFQGYQGEQTKLWVHTAADGGFGAPVMRWDSGAAGLDLTATSFVAGDFDGDGRADIGQLRGYDGAQTKLWVQYGLSAPVQRWDSGAGNLARATATFLAADVDGTGRRDEIVIMSDRGGNTARLNVLTAPATGTAAWTDAVWWSGTGFDTGAAVLSTGDFTGDGRADVAALYATGNGNRRMYTFASTGTSFADKQPGWEGYVGDTNTPFTVEPGQVYRIYPRHSEKCLGSTDAVRGTAITQSDCVLGEKKQQFTVERQGATEYFYLKGVSSKMCVDVYTWQHVDGAAAVQWTCNGSGIPQANQQFRLEYVEGSGVDVVVRLRPVHSEKCLDVKGASQNNGATLVQWSCGDLTKTNQLFYLRPEA